MTETKKKEEQLKEDLFSTTDTTVLKALKEIGEDGSRDMVLPVLELFGRTESEEIRELVKSQLSQLKIGDVEDVFISKLEDESFSHLTQDLVFCMWNSGMNPSDNLHSLASTAIKGDHLVVLEVLTLIENMEGPFDHESLIEAFSEVGMYVSENSDNTLKLELMKNLYAILHSFQEEN